MRDADLAAFTSLLVILAVGLPFLGYSILVLFLLVKNWLRSPWVAAARAVRLIIYAQGEEMEMLKLTDRQQVVLTIAPVDATGNAAKVEKGSVKWEGPLFLTLTPDKTGMSASVVVNRIQGSASGDITVSADADLGAGVLRITESLSVEVTGSEAVSLGLAAGEVTEQAADPAEQA